MKAIARFIFENGQWNPFWNAWFAGYAVIGADGSVYLSAAGEEYLAEVDGA